jgi:hypothetical protein
MGAAHLAQGDDAENAHSQLVEYYLTQRYDLVRETDHKGRRLFMMARAAERLDLAGSFTGKRWRLGAGR